MTKILYDDTIIEVRTETTAAPEAFRAVRRKNAGVKRRGKLREECKTIVKSFFGETADGRRVDLYSVKNSNGTTVDIITYGAAIKSVYAADGNGKFADILLGFDDIGGYEKYSDYQGATVGRYANRIENGRFVLDSKTYELVKNEKGKTCLHGGGELSSAVWNAVVTGASSLEASYFSPDGAMGFPGNVEFKTTFTLREDDSLEILYSAVSDKKTVINPTNHAYFNLAGKGDVSGCELYINADSFTPVNADGIPTGEIRPVEGTAFDFRIPKPIGKDIDADDEQLRLCGGYDHNFCLNAGPGPAAAAYDPESGRTLEVFTDFCGLQFYTGNFLDGTKTGKRGEPLIKRSGFCLETQFYPNSPNVPKFPQCVFNAGEKFSGRAVFKFSARRA